MGNFTRTQGHPFSSEHLAYFTSAGSSQGVGGPDNLRHPGHPKANTCHPCPHRCPRAHLRSYLSDWDIFPTHFYVRTY